MKFKDMVLTMLLSMYLRLYSKKCIFYVKSEDAAFSMF